MRDVWSIAIIGATLVALAFVASKRKRHRRIRITIEYDDGKPPQTEDEPQ